jgi:hypothetical protein
MRGGRLGAALAGAVARQREAVHDCPDCITV